MNDLGKMKGTKIKGLGGIDLSDISISEDSKFMQIRISQYEKGFRVSCVNAIGMHVEEYIETKDFDTAAQYFREYQEKFLKPIWDKFKVVDVLLNELEG